LINNNPAPKERVGFDFKNIWHVLTSRTSRRPQAFEILTFRSDMPKPSKRVCLSQF
jgi:hypothetical protein